MQFEKWYDIDLKKPRQFVPDIGFPTFEGDNNSVRIGVNVFSDKTPSDVTGTIKGYCILPNGVALMPWDGAKDGNRAWIDVPDDALIMNGRITLSIRCFDADETTVLFQASATVRRVDSERHYDPEDEIGDVTDLIEEAERVSGVAAQAAQDAQDALAQASDIVSYATQTGQTDAQKATARTNIEAASEQDVSDLRGALDHVDSFVETANQITRPFTQLGYIRDNGTIGASTTYTLFYFPCYVGYKYEIRVAESSIIKIGFGPSYNQETQLVAYAATTGTTLSMVCPASAEGGFVIAQYNNSQAASAKLYRYQNNIAVVNTLANNNNTSIANLRTTLAENTPQNSYYYSSNWSGEWNNADSWTNENATYRGLQIRKRTGTWLGLNHAVNVESGKHYHFSGWCMVSSAQALQIAIKSTDSTATVSVDNKTIPARDMTEGKWRKFNVEFDCTESGTIHPTIQAINSTTLYVAGFCVAEGFCNDKPVYTCEQNNPADFNRLTTAVFWATMFMDATIYLGAGEWDVVDEFGSTYMEAVGQSKRGMYLMNRVKLICASESTITAEYDGDNETTMLWFSAFNSGKYGFTLENANIVGKNIRYCVHDERDTDADQYTNRYIDCKMYLDNSENTGTNAHQCIGGGLGLNGHIVIEGGDYESVNTLNPPSVCYDPISYHNSAGSGKSRIDINGVYIHDGTIRINWYGTSTDITEAYVHGCSLTHDIRSFAEKESATIQNVSVIKWNNEIRST